MSNLDIFTCEETFNRLNDYLDRELSPEEITKVEAHLKTCLMCAEEYTFEASVLNEVRNKMQRVAVPSNLLAKISLALSQVQASLGD